MPFLWQSQKFDPHRIETPDLIEIKFDTINYLDEMTPGAKFHAHPSMGGFSANGGNICPKFLFAPFSGNSPTGQTPRRILARDGSHKGVPFGG